MLDLRNIRGAGGGGGGGEASDTLRSTQTADILDLISEGECEGLVNGLKSIYFDGVPLQADDGSFNFQGWSVTTTLGTQGQASISGTDGVQNELGVGVTVLAATPIVRTISNAAIDTCRVTIVVPQLSRQDTDSGDLGGSSFRWSIEVQSAGGGFVEVFNETVSGKTMSRYARSAKFKLEGSAPWDIKVRRLTPDSASASIVNAFAWATYAEIQSLKLRYPNSALVRTRVGAEQFARIPVRSFDWMGLRIQVPTNYDPKTRVYTGVWDGTFKIAWTDNPAWIYHDMVRNNRYGLGRYVSTTDAFKWELYGIGRYCDEMVPDGRGGMEPRFRASPQLETREQAYKVLTDLAAIFRGMAYWLNSDVAVIQDAPGDLAASYVPANVVNKKFTYSGASASKRYSSVVVWFNSLADRGKLVPEIVVDRDLESRIGVRTLELSPLGVWSRGQAQRIGKWVIYTQQHEKRGVVFQVGLDGVLTPPGKVFEIMDPADSGERLGGRVRGATTSQVTLDREVNLAAGESYLLSVMIADPDDSTKLIRVQRAVTTPAGATNILTLAAPLDSAPSLASVWLLQSNQVQATIWRCVGVTDNDDNTFTVTGLEHAPQKYALVEQGIEFEKPSISRIKATPSKPTDLLLTEVPYLSGTITRSRVTVSWQSTEPGLSFLVTWQLNDGPWTQVPITSANSVDIDGLARGELKVTVQSRNSIGNFSTPLSDSKILRGKTALPPQVADLAARVVQGGVEFTWTPSAQDDYLANTVKINGVVRFEGAASRWTWPWPDRGTYTVAVTEWDTSFNESLPVTLPVVVDDGVLVDWARLGGVPTSKIFNNLIDPSWWAPGATLQWNLNETEGGENSIIWDIGPKGSPQALWKALQKGVANASADGGWNPGTIATTPTNAFKVDPTKTYRIVVPIKRVTGGGGYAYLGISPHLVTTLNTSTPNPNPYFALGTGAAAPPGRWLLFVGYVFPAGATGLTDAGAGIFDMTTGEQVNGGANFNWAATTTEASTRAFQYYADAGAIQLFGYPMVHMVDGSEPSLRELLQPSALLNKNQLWVDIGGTGKPADNATRNRSFQQYGDPVVAPGGIGDGDEWVQTDVSGTVVIAVFKRITGAWVSGPAGFSWVVRGNCVANGGSIRKSGGASAWDSDASSQEAFTGGAFCSFQAAQANAELMCGLNTDPATDRSYTSLDYAFYCTSVGDLVIYESGSGYSGYGTYTPDTALAITYEGTTVRYLKDGVVVRSVAAASGLKLYFDSSFATPGAAVKAVRFGPQTDISGVVAAAAAAASAAAAAQSSANTANAQLSDIANDNVLTPVEKAQVILDVNVIGAEQSGIDAQATNYAVTTEKTAYDNAVSALATYLSTLTSPFIWSSLSGNTNITGTTFRSKFADVYTTRQAVLDKIAANAKARLGALATLNTVDTPQIEPNAATDVYVASSTNVVITGQAGVPTGSFTDLITPIVFVAGVTGDALLQCEGAAILVTTSNPSAELATRILVNGVSQGPRTYAYDNYNLGTSSSANASIFRTRRFPIVAGTSYTVLVQAQQLEPSTTTVTVTSFQARIEEIKR